MPKTKTMEKDRKNVFTHKFFAICLTYVFSINAAYFLSTRAAVMLIKKPYWVTLQFVLPTVYVVLIKKNSMEVLGYRKEKAIKGYLAGLAIALPLRLIEDHVKKENLFSFLSAHQFWTSIETIPVEELSLSQKILATLICFTVPPMCEETFYRGFLQQYLEKRMGKCGIIVQAMLFAVNPLHLGQGVAGVFFAFYYGIALGAVFYFSRSMAPLFSMHGMVNAYPVLLSLL